MWYGKNLRKTVFFGKYLQFTSIYRSGLNCLTSFWAYKDLQYILIFTSLTIFYSNTVLHSTFNYFMEMNNIYTNCYRWCFVHEELRTLNFLIKSCSLIDRQGIIFFLHSYGICHGLLSSRRLSDPWQSPPWKLPLQD